MPSRLDARLAVEVCVEVVAGSDAVVRRFRLPERLGNDLRQHGERS
ncbi:hypothetical protein [Streptomyces europaeiscabiei]|nr:hypothetical protein [Streptomyces europaeiscabiei]MDX3587219.1 hypothetical protein [Streptomyces europaeiscabiei]